MIYKASWPGISGGEYRHHPRYRGCTAHYTFIEGGGTTLYDISGYRVNGTLTNMAPSSDWTSNPTGACLDFDGTDDRVQIADNASNDLLTNWTVFVDCVVRDTTSTQAFVVKGPVPPSTANLDTNYMLFITGGTTYTRYGNGASFIDATVSASLGRHQYVAVLDSSNLTLWDNVVSGTPTPRTINPVNAAQLTIGDFNFATNFPINSQINHVRLYDRPLIQDEIASLYTNPWLEFEDYRKPWTQLNSVAAAAVTRRRLLPMMGVGY